MAKKKELTEQEIIQVLRKKKIRKDARDLKLYRQRLEAEKTVLHQKFSITSINQRKSRALALGAIMLEGIDKVRELNAGRVLVPGTLQWTVTEQKVQDDTGRKGFDYSVTFHVVEDKPAHSKEDIDREIEETFEKMMKETDELFPAEEVKKSEEEQSQSADVQRQA